MKTKINGKLAFEIKIGQKIIKKKLDNEKNEEKKLPRKRLGKN
jgi:hypothetical protein